MTKSVVISGVRIPDDEELEKSLRPPALLYDIEWDPLAGVPGLSASNWIEPCSI